MAQFIKLTAYSGHDLIVNADLVVKITPSTDEDGAMVFFAEGHKEKVQGTPQQVGMALNGNAPLH